MVGLGDRSDPGVRGPEGQATGNQEELRGREGRPSALGLPRGTEKTPRLMAGRDPGTETDFTLLSRLLYSLPIPESIRTPEGKEVHQQGI